MMLYKWLVFFLTCGFDAVQHVHANENENGLGNTNDKNEALRRNGGQYNDAADDNTRVLEGHSGDDDGRVLSSTNKWCTCVSANSYVKILVSS